MDATVEPPTQRAIEMMTFAINLMVVAVACNFLSGFGDRFFDFNIYYFGALAERSGSFTDLDTIQQLALTNDVPVPTEGAYGTATLIALVYVPLSYLELTTAHTIWTIATVILTAVAVHIAAGRNITSPIWIVALLLGYSMWTVIALGNAALLTFSLIVGCFTCIRNEHQKTAGLLLGTAIALKAYPALLIIPLVIKKRWGILATTVTTSTAAVAVTIPVIGLDGVMPALRQLVDAGGTIRESNFDVSVPSLILTVSKQQWVAEMSVLVMLGATIVLLYRLRHLETHVLFAVAIGACLLSQSLAWSMYFTTTIVMGIVIWERSSSLLWRFAGLAAFCVSNSLLTTLTGMLDRWTCAIQATATVCLVIMVIIVHQKNASNATDTVSLNPKDGP